MYLAGISSGGKAESMQKDMFGRDRLQEFQRCCRNALALRSRNISFWFPVDLSLRESDVFG